MSKSIYDYCKEFKRKFPGTIAWRMKQHCSVVENHLNDDEVVAIITKQIKMRKDSIEEFKKASRDDLVEKTQKEVDILVTYMPEQLSEEEINKIIDEIF